MIHFIQNSIIDAWNLKGPSLDRDPAVLLVWLILASVHFNFLIKKIYSISGPRIHVNVLTSPIDANFLYGSTDELARNLRAFTGGNRFLIENHVLRKFLNEGLLRTWDRFQEYGLKPLLPPQSENPGSLISIKLDLKLRF